MATKTSGASVGANSRPKLMELCVEVAKRYQDAGHDIELVRDHLASPVRESFGAARIAAAMLSAASLTQALTRMLILELSEESPK